MRFRLVSLPLVALLAFGCASTPSAPRPAVTAVRATTTIVDDGCTPQCCNSPCWQICPAETPPDCDPCGPGPCPTQTYPYATPCCRGNQCPQPPPCPNCPTPGPVVNCANGTTEAQRPMPACTSTDPTPCGLGLTPGAVQFAVIGDWGNAQCGECAGAVAGMLKGFHQQSPFDFVLTTGDNFYPLGSQQDIEANMPLYNWLCPSQANCPQPQPGEPALFIPTVGNHDLYTECGRHYFDYFTALSPYAPSQPPNTNTPPWTPRYFAYTVPGGLIDIFSLNSNDWEPDGIGPGCKQAMWLKGALAGSRAQWKIVVFHEPPYSNHCGGQERHMRWPFSEWGATLVISGHVHGYERIVDPASSFTYVVNGLAGTIGHDPVECLPPIPGTEVRYAGSVGAMVATATASRLNFCMMVLDSKSPNGYACIDNFSFLK